VSMNLKSFTIKIHDIEAEWSKAKRVLIIIGQREQDDTFDRVVSTLTEHPHVVVLTETTSNVRAKGVLPSIDRVIDSIGHNEYEDFAPDLIISCGASIVSKKIRFMLRQMGVEQHWHVDPYDSYIDTYQALSRMVPLEPSYLFELLVGLDCSSSDSDYKERWMTREQHTSNRHKEYLEQCEWCDLKVFDILIREVSKGCLHVASSTPVRYAQLFPPRKDLIYKCNRGISGIDGCSSTAAGYAYMSDDVTTLITGDLAFFYDSNALWHHHLKPNLKIIMINNAGGNIFRYVKGPDKTDHLEKHFEATHHTNAEYIAKTFDIQYFSASDEKSTLQGLRDLYHTDRVGILEIHTPREKNIDLLKDYFRFLNPNIKSD